MSSILKVDTIQTTAGAAPSTGTLGFRAGSIVQYQERYYDLSTFTTSSASMVDVTNYYVDITPTKATNKIRVQFGVLLQTDERLGYGRFSVVDSNNSDTRFNVNSVAESSFYQGTAWDTSIIVAVAAANTTNTMRLQLQIFTSTGTTNEFGWSSGDSRHIEAWEIAQ